MDLVFEGAEALAKSYERYVSFTYEQIGRIQPAAASRLGELADFGKGNLEAWILAGSEAAKGWESLAAEVMGCNSKVWGRSMKCAEALLGCSDLAQVTSIQSEAVKDQFDTLLEESSKLREMTAAAASAMVQPSTSGLARPRTRLRNPSRHNPFANMEKFSARRKLSRRALLFLTNRT